MNKIYQKMISSFKNSAAGKAGGFTLIELLVVVLIIGILAAIALPQYEKAVERSRAAEALTMVSSIAKAQEIYKMTTGNYTTDMSVLDIEVPGTDVTANGYGRKETKLFQYGSYSPSYTNSVAIAKRLPVDSKYSIVALDDGTVVCHYFTGWEDFCRSMGSGQAYSGNPSYVIH